VNTTRLTVADIDTLIDALQAWEEEPVHAHAARSLVIAIISTSREGDVSEPIDQAMTRQGARAEETVRRRRRVAARLKVLLLDLREEAVAAAPTGEEGM
jgi:hypothetical protein